MNALAHAIAHGPATATRATSDIAKTREGTTPHHTTREMLRAQPASWRLVTYRADRDAMMALTRKVPA